MELIFAPRSGEFDRGCLKSQVISHPELLPAGWRVIIPYGHEIATLSSGSHTLDY